MKFTVGIVACVLAAVALAHPLGTDLGKYNNSSQYLKKTRAFAFTETNTDLVRKVRAINIGSNQTIHGDIISGPFDDDVNIGIGGQPNLKNSDSPQSPPGGKSADGKGAAGSIQILSSQYLMCAGAILLIMIGFM